MKTRIGKIARLPKLIRDELNHRLENGADGPELLAWLNALPEVQRVLAEKFGGRPLTKHNLSDWRHGGYAEWSAALTGRAQWQELIEQGCALNKKGTGPDGTDVSSYLGAFMIVELAEALDELHEMKDSKQRWKLLQLISRALARLQNERSRDKRIRLWEAQEGMRNGQIAASRPESPPKKLFSQSCFPSDQGSPAQNSGQFPRT
jgi:hypothetical protein